jgi:transcriptional regulator with XRE-family HTH domain
MERVFAENLLKARKSRGFRTQEAMAEAAGIPFRTYQDIERGVHLPRGSNLKKIADALKVSESALYRS